MRRTLVTLFAVYLVGLAWLILFKFEVPYIGEAAGLARPFKLVPFVASGDAGPSNPLEVLANVVFFVPFGIYLRLLTGWLWRSLAIVAGASLALELLQHLLSVGSFDTTDVIANTAGGLLGLLLARVLAPPVMTRILLIGGVATALAIAAFIASPLQYHAPRDVVVERL